MSDGSDAYKALRESYLNTFPEIGKYAATVTPRLVAKPGSFASASFASALTHFEDTRDDLIDSYEIAFRMFKNRPPIPFVFTEAPDAAHRRRMHQLRGKSDWGKAPKTIGGAGWLDDLPDAEVTLK